jgi:hypothetical protein
MPSPGAACWATDATAWTTEKWTGDDKPYSAARLRTEREVAASHDPLAVVARYKALAHDNPHNALAVFCWASAAYAAVPFAASDNEYEKCVLGVLDALAGAPSPHTYEYARMRYLIQLCGYWDMTDLTSLGHRLLKTNIDDPDVLEQVAVLTPDLTSGVALVRKSIKIRPGRLNSYLHLGEIYYESGGNPGNRERAIENFKIYLSMSPRESDTRKWAVQTISYLNSKLAEAKTK